MEGSGETVDWRALNRANWDDRVPIHLASALARQGARAWAWEAIKVIRRIPFAGALNFRDIGGYPTGTEGRTRWGAVYRSDSLSFLTPDDLPAFDALGIKAIYDLRRSPGRRADGACACGRRYATR